MNKNLCRDVTIANVRMYAVNVNVNEHESVGRIEEKDSTYLYHIPR